jgi:ResB-like family
LLASAKFAVAVIMVIAVACVIGTLLPQGAEATAYVERNPGAAARFVLFGRLGLTHIFSAWWFVGLLCVLASTVMVCSTRRLATVKHVRGFAQRRALGSMLTHLSILFILSGAVVRGIWGEKGSIEMREGETIARFEGARGVQPLPFALQLARFEIETDADVASPDVTPRETSPTLVVQWTERSLQATISAKEGTVKKLTPEGEAPSPNNTFQIEVMKYVPDFAVDTTTHEVTSRSTQPNNPAVLVAVNGPDYHNHRWVFAKYPDFAMHEDGSPIKASPLRFIYQHDDANSRALVSGPIKNFKSTFHLIEDGKFAGTGTAAVNRPLKVGGYTFYQTGYNPNDLSWTSLEVVRDPGVPLVYCGFGLLIAGLFVVFYLNPWLSRRTVAAGVSPAVEPGVPPGGLNVGVFSRVKSSSNVGKPCVVPGGKMPPSTASETLAATAEAI